jgi:LytS/YehU family sensor histidine kinase
VEKSESAPEVILKLSDMMRYVIYEGNKDLVALKDEINYLENYIELHKIRYRRKVDISFTHMVEEELKVAPLLFIILLENAFKHGVEKTNGDAFIRLSLETQGKLVIFSIENSFDSSISNSADGIGLENLKRRLAHFYKKRHSLVIEQNEPIYKVQLNLEVS